MSDDLSARFFLFSFTVHGLICFADAITNYLQTFSISFVLSPVWLCQSFPNRITIILSFLLPLKHLNIFISFMPNLNEESFQGSSKIVPKRIGGPLHATAFLLQCAVNAKLTECYKHISMQSYPSSILSHFFFLISSSILSHDFILPDKQSWKFFNMGKRMAYVML